MDSLLITTDGRSLSDVRARLAHYLPGLDVSLTPLSMDRALLPAPVLRALRNEYQHVDAILAVAGVARFEAVSDSAALGLLDQRDVDALPPRPAAPALAPGAVAWHLAMVHAPQAWALLGGADQIDWTGVRVGHIDTGWTAHPALGFAAQPWVLTALGETFFAPSGGDPGSVPGPGLGEDPLGGAFAGHGTRTGSMICGRASAPGFEFFGVAPRVPLVAVRIADHVLINHAQVQFAQAVDHLVDRAGVGIISLSMGVFPRLPRKELRRAVNKAYESGVILVCAAGQPVQSVVVPACLSRSVAVSGVTSSGQPWLPAAHGDTVDFSAPADEVLRASTRRDGQFEYGLGDGTSFAAAMTSGAAALWLAHRRQDLATAYGAAWMRVEAFTRLARQTAVAPPGWQSGSHGSGILNIEALLNAPLPVLTAADKAVPA